jgi:hypothetical protein
MEVKDLVVVTLAENLMFVKNSRIGSTQFWWVSCMNKVKLSVYVFCYATLFPSIVSLISPLPSTAYVIRVGRIDYSNCSELQRDMNSHNRGEIFKGFERSEMGRRGYSEGDYMLYCNGGVIVSRADRIICRGYIAYGYSPTGGTSEYFRSWGRTDGSSNSADTGKERYCKKLK